MNKNESLDEHLYYIAHTTGFSAIKYLLSKAKELKIAHAQEILIGCQKNFELACALIQNKIKNEEPQ